MEDLRDARDPEDLYRRMLPTMYGGGKNDQGHTILEAADVVVGNHGGGSYDENETARVRARVAADRDPEWGYKGSGFYPVWLKAQALEQARVHHGQLERAGKL